MYRYDAMSPPTAAIPYLTSGNDLQFCWHSSRGIIGDTQETLGGVCVSTDGLCYWRESTIKSGMQSKTVRAVGCGDYSRPGGVQSTTSRGTIEWTAGGTTDSGARCYEDGITRYCVFAATDVSLYPRAMITSSR